VAAAVATAAHSQTIGPVAGPLTGKATVYDVNLQDNRLPEAGVQVEKPLNGDDKDKAIVRKLNGWGVQEGEKTYSDKQGRWYLFAAAKGRSVGLNMVRDGSGHMANQGLTTDQTALVGTAEAGLGWRKGNRQLSVGFQERRIQSANDWIDQTTPHSDHGVGLTFSIRR
jgi:hypothetical protein